MNWFKAIFEVRWDNSRHMGPYDASAVKHLAEPSNPAVFDGIPLIHKGKGLGEGHSALAGFQMQRLKAM